MKKRMNQFYRSLMARPGVFRTALNVWPPFLCSGVKITQVTADYRQVTVELRQRLYNRNHFGTHFGGTLFAMLDPFFMFMVLNNIDKDRYYVWDRDGSIQFNKPGKGTVKAVVAISQHQIDEILKQTASGEKYLPTFQTQIIDEVGDTVATCQKTLYIKLKPKYRESAQ